MSHSSGHNEVAISSMLENLCSLSPVGLRLGQELPLLQGAGTQTQLLHHGLGGAAVTQHLRQDHLRHGGRDENEIAIKETRAKPLKTIWLSGVPRGSILVSFLSYVIARKAFWRE